jgi:cytochrome c553
MRRLLSAVLLGLCLGGTAVAGEIEDLAQSCTACHGEVGQLPADPAYPIIAGQQFYYLYVQLKDFASGLRENEIMQGIVAGMDRKTMQAVAQYWSEQPWPATAFTASEEDATRAERIAVSGQCSGCHLGGFEGNSRVPRLRNQQPGYLEKTMLDFKSKRRKNAPDMNALFTDVADEDIAALARYLAAL